MRFPIVIALALAVTAPVAAQTPTEPATTPPPVKKADRLKCRMEAPIGSLVPKRVCTTSRIEEQNRDEAKILLQRPVQGIEPL